MAFTKLDLAVVAAIAGGLLWIEHSHRVVIGTPAAAEVAPSPTSVCPDTDDVPFSADCLAFIGGGMPPKSRSGAINVSGVGMALAGGLERVEQHVPACPASNENAPYSAKCIQFLSGWYWQADPKENAP